MRTTATFEVKTLNRVPADPPKGRPAADVIKCAHVGGAGGEAGSPDGYSELRLRIEDPAMLGQLRPGMRLTVEISADA